MKRRRYLAAATGLASTPLAGCSSLASDRSLGPPTEQPDDRSVHLVYEHDGEEVLVVSYLYQGRDAPAIHRVRAVVQQPGDTTLDALELRLRTVADEPATIYLDPPRTNYGTNAYRDDEWTVVEVPDYGDYGRGTTGHDFLVRGDVHGGGDVSSLHAEHDVTVTGDGLLGRTYTARDLATVDLEERPE